MPNKYTAPANSINDKQFIPDLRKKLKGLSSGISYTEYTEETNTIQLPCGELIPDNSLCYINDGLVYLADTEAAECFVLNGGATGTIVNLIVSGIVDYTTTYERLFKSNTGTLSDSLGTIIQEVAFKINESQIFINIREPYYNE